MVEHVAPNASASSFEGSSSSSEYFAVGREGEARQELFNTIAPVYDELNDMLSFGLHRVWKRMAVKWSEAAVGATALDVCCGSGDLAFRLAEAVGPSGKVSECVWVGAEQACAGMRASCCDSRVRAWHHHVPETAPVELMHWEEFFNMSKKRLSGAFYGSCRSTDWISPPTC